MKYIYFPENNIELEKFMDNVLYEMNGQQIFVTEPIFQTLWNENVFKDFYEQTGVFIDEFETTIITENDHIVIFKSIIEKNIGFGFKYIKEKKEILELVKETISKNLKMIFFF